MAGFLENTDDPAEDVASRESSSAAVRSLPEGSFCVSTGFGAGFSRCFPTSCWVVSDIFGDAGGFAGVDADVEILPDVLSGTEAATRVFLLRSGDTHPDVLPSVGIEALTVSPGPEPGPETTGAPVFSDADGGWGFPANRGNGKASRGSPSVGAIFFDDSGSGGRTVEKRESFTVLSWTLSVISDFSGTEGRISGLSSVGAIFMERGTSLGFVIENFRGLALFVPS